jgi:MFS family permease
VKRGYGALFRQRYVPSMVLWAVVARLPTGVGTLLLALTMVQAGFSGAALGTVVAARTVAGAVCSPWFGRLVDGGYATRILIATGALHLVALSTLLAGLHAGWSTPVLAAVAVLWGVGSPPHAGITRPMWPRLVGKELLPVAFSLEVLIIDVMYVGGPLLASLVAATAGPSIGLWVTGLGVAVGSTMLGLTGAVRVHAPRPNPLHRSERPPRERLFRGFGPFAVLTVGACLLAFSLWTEVMIPLQMAQLGLPGLSGVLIAIWSVGSIIGVLAFLRFQPHWALWNQLLLFLGIYLIPTGLLLLAGTSVWVYAIVLFFVGLLVSPCTNLQMQLGHEVAPESRQAEMFTWMGTAGQIGSSIGSLLAGFASDVLPTSLAVGGAGVFIVVAIVAALFAIAARRRSPARAQIELQGPAAEPSI